MSISLLFSFLLFSFLLFFFHPYPSSADPFYHSCDDSGNYTANSTYATNLNFLLSTIPTNTSSNSGFSNSTSGSIPDQVSALALCRGDTNSSDCRSCLDVAIQDGAQLCPYYKSATIYYDLCLLSYSNQFFLSSTENSHQVFAWNAQNVTGQRFPRWDPTKPANCSFFNSVINTMFTQLTYNAVHYSTSKFATGEMNITGGFPTLYSLVQCTPDLSDVQCYDCLQDLINRILIYSNGSEGGRIVGVRCNLRYEAYRFYDGDSSVMMTMQGPTTPVGNSPSPPPPSGGKSKLWIIITATSLASLLGLSLLCFLWIKRRRRRAREEKEEPRQRQPLSIETNEASRLWKNEENNPNFSLYKFSQIEDATNRFSPENKLGEGGFGPVYKGQLPEGLEIAAKRLSADSGQGQVEFKNEIQLIAKLQHRNLVSLIGCCIEGDENILIYEYMPNKSLDVFLFDQTRGPLLDWSKRFHIIEGIAQGLLYLHKHSRLRIIHRDLKASNVLLDRDMNPKISDFGMARIFSSNEVQGNTNKVVGTYGYMSPEYAYKGLFSTKSDVFSFGVLLLEIVSGKRNASFQQYDTSPNLLSYAWALWKEGKWLELVDTSLGTEFYRDEIMRCINVALMCVQENAMDRPTMSIVISLLNSESANLPDPKQPAFFNLKMTTEIEEALDVIRTSSVNGMTITIPYGR